MTHDRLQGQLKRGVALGVDASRIRTGVAQVGAGLRNAAISLQRLCGAANLAGPLRESLYHV